jgi:EAL domain-containing protein (putative c-di-GMP-specific phosphodiesterase class I)
MAANHLLLLEADAATGRSIAEVAARIGYRCESVASQEDFRRSYALGAPSMIVLDVDPADESGSAVLRYLVEQACRLPLVLVTSFDRTALEAAGHLARLRGLRVVDMVGKAEAPARVQRALRSVEAHEVLDFGEEIEGALKRGEIYPRYQPIFELGTSSVAGVEALMRWEHALLGVLPASDFVRVADRAGVLEALEEHVIDRAITEFFALTPQDAFLALNVSLRQIVERRFAEKLLRRVGAAGGTPSRITLEVTEGCSMEEPARTLAALGRLRSAGVRLALDDFGKGYSSLSLLQRVPFDALKIDAEFVRRAPASKVSRTILAMLVGLGRSLRLDVVAEGIESDACLEVVRRAGVTLGQGFALTEPLALDGIARLLDAASVPDTA